nr:MAG TPA: hypothetical protein [Caudoviricetes sp.]
MTIIQAKLRQSLRKQTHLSKCPKSGGQGWRRC